MNLKASFPLENVDDVCILDVRCAPDEASLITQLETIPNDKTEDDHLTQVEYKCPLGSWFLKSQPPKQNITQLTCNNTKWTNANLTCDRKGASTLYINSRIFIILLIFSPRMLL